MILVVMSKSRNLQCIMFSKMNIRYYSMIQYQIVFQANNPLNMKEHFESFGCFQNTKPFSERSVIIMTGLYI